MYLRESASNMRRSAIKTALKLRKYLLDERIKDVLKKDLDNIGIEVKIKQ